MGNFGGITRRVALLLARNGAPSTAGAAPVVSTEPKGGRP